MSLLSVSLYTFLGESYVFLCLGELMVLALDSFRFSFVALSEFEDFPFSRNWLLLRELVRLWLASLNIAFFWVKSVVCV